MFSIPSVGMNLIVVSSQEQILPMEEGHVHKQTYLLIEKMHEGVFLTMKYKEMKRYRK